MQSVTHPVSSPQPPLNASAGQLGKNQAVERFPADDIRDDAGRSVGRDRSQSFGMISPLIGSESDLARIGQRLGHHLEAIAEETSLETDDQLLDRVSTALSKFKLEQFGEMRLPSNDHVELNKVEHTKLADLVYPTLQMLFKALFFMMMYFVKVKGEIKSDDLKEGRAVIAANHSAASDSVAMAINTDKRLYFLSKKSLFDVPIWGSLMKAMNQIPVDRSGKGAGLGALQSAKERLMDSGQHEKIVAMFPEGTRSKDGKLYKFKTGVTRLALSTESPVIPVGLINFRDFTPFANHEIRYGDPMDVEACAKEILQNHPDILDGIESQDEAVRDQAARDLLAAVTDKIRIAVNALTGQEYAGEFNAHRSKGAQTAADKPKQA